MVGRAVTPLTARQWLMLRLDDPPHVFVMRAPGGHGGWQVMLRIDGGYGAKSDAVDAGRMLGQEVHELWRKAHLTVDRDPGSG